MQGISILEETIQRHHPQNIHPKNATLLSGFPKNKADWRKPYIARLLELQERKCIWCQADLTEEFQTVGIIPKKIRPLRKNYHFVLSCSDCKNLIQKNLSVKRKQNSLERILNLFIAKGKEANISTNKLLFLLDLYLEHPHLYKGAYCSELKAWIRSMQIRLRNFNTLEQDKDSVKLIVGKEKQSNPRSYFTHLTLLHNSEYTGRLSYILSQQEFKCVWCMSELKDTYDEKEPRRVTFEHVVPNSLCRSDTKENLTLACYQCNNSRGKENIYNFVLKLQKQGITPDLNLLIKSLNQFELHLKNKIKNDYLEKKNLLPKKLIIIQNYIIVQRYLLDALRKNA